MSITRKPKWATSPYTIEALAALPEVVDETTTPSVIDEAIFWLEHESRRIGNELATTLDALHIAFGERGAYDRKNGCWPTTAIEILDKAQNADPGTENADYYARAHYPTIGDILNARHELQCQRDEITWTVAPLVAQYAARKWSRVYLVTNSNGHAHSHLHCRNCYATTEYHWITEMSGASDADVVAAAGERTCLTCYPAVRGEILAGRPCRLETKETREERIARERETAEKKAAKIAKGITPDGSPLVVRLGGFHAETMEIKTERAAELRYVDLMAQPQIYEHLSADSHHYHSAADAILLALAGKRNTTTEDLAAALAPKVKAKIKRERGY